nr:uncharacterized protein LOC125419360 [Ziziphus jujuba var. spinosa]
MEDDDQMMEFYMKDAKALGIIQGVVTDHIFLRIANVETSKETCELLYNEFHGGDQMKTFGETLSNERMVQKVLISLTKAYEPICLVIGNTKDLTSVEFQENKGVTQANVAKFQKSWSSKEKKWEPKQRFQQRSHGPQMTNTNAANIVHGGNKWQVEGSQQNSKPQCKTCGKYHFGECRFKGKPQCYNCDKFGHWGRECTNGRNVQKSNCTNQMELSGNIFYAASEIDGSSKSSE